jgi:hypothetical protein
LKWICIKYGEQRRDEGEYIYRNQKQLLPGDRVLRAEKWQRNYAVADVHEMRVVSGIQRVMDGSATETE